MNGTLTTGSQIESGRPVVFASSIEMPVTPPSMKLLDSESLEPHARAQDAGQNEHGVLKLARNARFMDIADVLGHRWPESSTIRAPVMNPIAGKFLRGAKARHAELRITCTDVIELWQHHALFGIVKRDQTVSNRRDRRARR